MRSSERLIGIAQKPQRPGPEAQAGHPGIVAIQKDMRPVLLGVVERDAMLQVRARRHELAQPEQGVAHDIVSDQKRTWIVHPSGQREQLLAQLPRPPVLGPQFMELPESAQHRHELGRFPLPLTQLERPRVRLAHLGGREALDGPQRHTEGDQQR